MPEKINGTDVGEQATLTIDVEDMENETAGQDIGEEKKEERKKEKKRRRRFGDRRDGRRIRTLPAMTAMIPYIMKVRSDAQNHFEDEIDITNIEAYLEKKHKEGYINMGILHLFLASYVRAIAQRPGINRFVAGQHIYSRSDIVAVMTVKKTMTLDSPDTVVKVQFDPRDTAVQVYEKFEATVKEAFAKETNFDKTAGLLRRIPGLLLRFTVGLLRFLDYFDLLPRKLLKVSPFHGSFIITSMGSLGINPIYHHLYDFGTLPVFLSYGKKYTKDVINEDGSVERRHFVSLRVVTDERICDGYYYASAFKIVKRALLHPELLDTAIDTYLEDID